VQDFFSVDGVQRQSVLARDRVLHRLADDEQKHESANATALATPITPRARFPPPVARPLS
jgi:hypothetical protein